MHTYVCFTNSSMYVHNYLSPCSGDVAQALSTKAFCNEKHDKNDTNSKNSSTDVWYSNSTV